MTFLSALVGGLDALVASRAKAIEQEMLLAKALDEFDYERRLHQLEALSIQRFSMFT